MSPRDFRRELEADRCWDRALQALFEARGEAVEDCILQNREELIALCEFIEAHRIRSYLEIGTWTGRLVSTLQRLFAFERVAVCDDGYCRKFGLEHHFPPDAEVFVGRSDSDAFRTWRERLGHVDLVLIDANHAYQAVKRDFETARLFPHRFIALHDICGASRYTAGVRRLWLELDPARRLELIRPHRELGLETSTMGIGIWCGETLVDVAGPAASPASGA